MRNARINIRLLQKEKDQLIKNATDKKMNISQFIILNCIDEYDIHSPRNIEVATNRLLIVHDELNRIGRNLNQIARHINRNDTPQYPAVEKYLRTLAYNTELIKTKFSIHKLL